MADSLPTVSRAPVQIIIEPRTGWRVIDWKELRAYKDLLYLMVWRDLRVAYRQTVLGFGWAVIRPLFSMVVFSVIFGNLAKMPSDGVPYPVFALAGLVPWTYFSNAMAGSTQSLILNVGMLTKVYFPRLIIPLISVVTNLVDLAIAFVMLAIVMAFYGVSPSPNIVFLPLLIAIMLVAAAGVGLWLSALALQYRDVKHAMTFMMQILMYMAPVVWPVSLIMEEFPEWGHVVRIVYGLYPVAGVIEGFRSALLGTAGMPWDLIGMGTLSSVCLAVSGAYYFRRMERIFADVA